MTFDFTAELFDLAALGAINKPEMLKKQVFQCGIANSDVE